MECPLVQHMKVVCGFLKYKFVFASCNIYNIGRLNKGHPHFSLHEFVQTTETKE